MTQKTTKANGDENTASDMNDALRRKYEEICKLRSTAAIGDVGAKYAMAVIAKSVRDAPGKYGDRRMEKLAGALRTDKSLLGKEMRVTERWTLVQVESMASARKDGLVSWTHLVVLATVTDDAKRNAAFKEVVSKGLSVSALQRLLHPRVEAPPAQTTSGTTRSLSRAVARVEGLKRQLSVEVLDSLTALDEQSLVRDDIEHLAALATLLPEVVKTLTDSMERVRAVLGHAEPARVSARAEAAHA